ncbi:hypothetical protein ANN_24856 [Periplaneta americana]|uniref:Uncharacterized protein n=1 Tax=Periplaneta americana TaxID=6978 RepID=A0ABQ8RZU1_PERAM|nr:hypothetical protein ANN_24856 [Periplaneta americana]
MMKLRLDNGVTRDQQKPTVYFLKNVWNTYNMGAPEKERPQNLGERQGNLLKEGAPCVSKYTSSRLTYPLTREPYLIEDLRQSLLLLPTTEAYENLLIEILQKRKEVEEEFYTTSAMTDRSWEGANQQMRNVVTRLAVHGFHHKVVVITEDVQNVHLLLEYRSHIDVSLTCEHDPKLQEYCVCPQNVPQFDSEGIPNQAPETNKPMILNGPTSRNREGSDQVSVEAKQLGHLYLSIDQEIFDPSTGEPYD